MSIVAFSKHDSDFLEVLPNVLCNKKPSKEEIIAWIRIWKLWGKITPKIAETQDIFEILSFAQGSKSFSHLILKQPDAENIYNEAISLNIDIIVPTSVFYPKQLLKIYDFPLVIYTKGNLELLQKQLFAIVGSRSASNDALQIAYNFAKELSQNGIFIVSGFANGIDTAACKGAIDYGTVQILGSGLKKPYPPTNAKLFNEVLEKNGLFISEFPPSFSATPANFPIRNRIITGLSNGILIGQVNRKNGISGTLVTLRIAISQGKEIFAYPGNILDERYKISNDLLKNGTAHFVTCVKDIIEIIQLPKTEKIPINKKNQQKAIKDLFKIEESEQKLTDIDSDILDIISLNPISADEISIISNKSIIQVQEELSELEILGKISINSSGKYIKTCLTSF